MRWRWLKKIWIRLIRSNNRSLGTLFGCFWGLIVGILLVTVTREYSLPLVGADMQAYWELVGILLACATGGNLSSFIGASIDILTGERTMFDLAFFLYRRMRAPKPKGAGAAGAAAPTAAATAERGTGAAGRGPSQVSLGQKNTGAELEEIALTEVSAKKHYPFITSRSSEDDPDGPPAATAATTASASTPSGSDENV